MQRCRHSLHSPTEEKIASQSSDLSPKEKSASQKEQGNSVDVRPLTKGRGRKGRKEKTCITESGNKLHRGLPLPNLEPISPTLEHILEKNPHLQQIPYQRQRATNQIENCSPRSGRGANGISGPANLGSRSGAGTASHERSVGRAREMGGEREREAGLAGEVYLVGAGGVTSAAAPSGAPPAPSQSQGMYRRRQRLTDWGGPHPFPIGRFTA